MLTDQIPPPDLPEGGYPFIDQHYSRAELTMIDVPITLKNLTIAFTEPKTSRSVELRVMRGCQ
ncbi:hypothetical protein QO004_005021 [Rhizobium mesoamericanum]|uniref:hypothetical protein n=1 Tax=Rhizobium mesoamericanum TaxID=1079800 RepID=UPI00277F8093|nr:hypothetical protein [Rhizobium mesoamericanum]MDQ0563212.1 hypothetical protein [Rhizobium mesoamericanum]